MRPDFQLSKMDLNVSRENRKEEIIDSDAAILAAESAYAQVSRRGQLLFALNFAEGTKSSVSYHVRSGGTLGRRKGAKKGRLIIQNCFPCCRRPLSTRGVGRLGGN